jgi:hypothetical protein
VLDEVVLAEEDDVVVLELGRDIVLGRKGVGFEIRGQRFLEVIRETARRPLLAGGREPGEHDQNDERYPPPHLRVP